MKNLVRVSAVFMLLAGSALALTGERMPEIPLDKMSAAQRSVADAIMAGPRQRMSGPFNAWLRSPELADACKRSANMSGSIPRSTNASTRWRS